MSSTHVIFSPTQDYFIEWLQQAKEKVWLFSPFIKTPMAELILKRKPPQAELTVYTSYKPKYFCDGASDLSAIRRLIENGCSIWNCSRLHAKIYLFDDATAYIGSANLTPSGMNKNLECGVLLQDHRAVQELIERLITFSKDYETSPILLSTVQQTQALLDRLPKPATATVPDDDVLAIPARCISQSLTSGWTKEVFDLINEKIDKNVFHLNDVYFYESYFAQKYPDNQHIKDKIRQQLQILRDQGLLEAQGNGFYKKLWRDTKED